MTIFFYIKIKFLKKAQFLQILKKKTNFWKLLGKNVTDIFPMLRKIGKFVANVGHNFDKYQEIPNPHANVNIISKN